MMSNANKEPMTMDTNFDVFETKEEREEREAKKKQTEREARWAKGIAQAQAADPNVCCEKVYGGSGLRSFSGHHCTKPAKFSRQEHLDVYNAESPVVTRHYCTVHDPISRRERQDKKSAEEKREREAKWAREDTARHRSSLVSAAVGHLTNEQLEKLASMKDQVLALLSPKV